MCFSGGFVKIYAQKTNLLRYYGKIGYSDID